jgi:hypothetical protein
MHGRRLLVGLGLLAAFAAGAAVVYKWTDADGVVHYSDRAVPGAEKVVTAGSSTNGIGRTVNSPATAVPAKPAKPAAFSVLAIDSPTKEQVFFNDETVSVRLSLEPALKDGQLVTWNLNGQTLTDQAGALSFALPTLARGTYVIGATVSDPSTGQTQSADSVTFYVRQPSALAPLDPQRKK